MLGDKRGHARAGASMEKKGVGKWDVRCRWSTLHLTSPHMLSSSPLNLFFGMTFSATSRVTSQGADWAKGLRVAAATQESGMTGVAVRGGMGWLGGTALSEGTLFWWYVPRCVL